MVGLSTSIFQHDMNSKWITAFRVSILDNEMLHAMPWCLVIGMSLIVRLDPNLPSLSKLDSLNLLSYFYWRVWDWHAYFSRGFLLMQLAARYWKWFNLVFLVRCIQLNHLEYPAIFTKHLVYADISKKTCFGREWERFTLRYCQHILH